MIGIDDVGTRRDIARRARIDLNPEQQVHALDRYALTAREREIAGLVHEGLTNRQIAHALFLSVRTVESHIYQARSKIGARNRSDLGSMVGSDRQEQDEPRRSWA